MFSKETKDTHRECTLQTTWLCPTESGPPCKAHNNFWTTTFPQVLWGLKALTFSKGTQGIDGCIFTLLRARVSPDTPTPSKSNLSDQTKTNFCHWENWTSARQNPQHSLWSLDDHQNKHLELSSGDTVRKSAKSPTNTRPQAGEPRNYGVLCIGRDLEGHLHPCHGQEH